MAQVTKQQVEEAFASATKDNNLCGVGKMLESLEPDVGAVIGSKVEDVEHYSAATIARVLKGLGFPPMSSNAIVAHRKGSCRCK